MKCPYCEYDFGWNTEATRCPECGTTLGQIVKAEALNTTTETTDDSGPTRALKVRYRDAYFVAKATVGFGALVKGIGILLAAVIFLVTIAATTSSPNGGSGIIVFSFGVLIAVVSGLLFYLLGGYLFPHRDKSLELPWTAP